MQKTFFLIILAAVLLFGLSCSVEESPSSGGYPHGSILVTVYDESSQVLSGARILVDGIERLETAPAYIHGISEGAHQVTARSFGYWSETADVDVVAGDTVEVEIQLTIVVPDQTGQLSVTSNPEGARLLLDGNPFLVNGSPLLTPLTTELPMGEYTASVHLAGHATLYPLNPLVEVTPDVPSGIEFTLEARQTGAQVGMLPFDFTLENVLGDSIRLNNLTGRVVLINFWYADCVPCMHEFPGIQSVYQRHAADGFEIVAVNPMFPDDRTEVLRVREEQGLTFQLLLDWDRYVTTTLYNVSVFPRNILIDRTGTISEVLQSVTEEELENLVAPLVEEE